MSDDRYDLAAGAAFVKQALTEAGLSASVDPRQVEVPGCFIALTNIRFLTLAGDTELDVTCWLVAPDNGDHLVHLSALFALAAPAVEWTADLDMPVVALQLPDRTLPAIQLTTKLTLSNT